MAKNMANLIICKECGKQISSEALSCPHCHTKAIRGAECKICMLIGKASEMMAITAYFATPNAYGQWGWL